MPRGMRENLSLKLFSIGLALLLELFFYSPDNLVTAKLTANVRVNLGAEMMRIDAPGIPTDDTIEVSIQGPSPMVEKTLAATHEFVVDVPQNSGGRYEATLNPSQLRLPVGVQVLDVEPSRVVVSIEKRVKKELVVVVNRRGEMPNGYILEQVRVTPETVMAVGPESELNGLSVVATNDLDFSQFRASTRAKLGLASKGPFTIFEPNVITVDVTVSAVIKEKEFSNVPVRARAPEGFAASVMPSVVNVVLSGPAEAIENLEKHGVELIADGAKKSAGKYEVVPTGEFSTGVNILKVQPPEVSLTLFSGHS